MGRKRRSGATHSWLGRKDEMLTIRVTAKEKAEVRKAAEDRGGMGVSRYLLNLHHKEMGTIR